MFGRDSSPSIKHSFKQGAEEEKSLFESIEEPLVEPTIGDLMSRICFSQCSSQALDEGTLFQFKPLTVHLLPFSIKVYSNVPFFFTIDLFLAHSDAKSNLCNIEFKVHVHPDDKRRDEAITLDKSQPVSAITFNDKVSLHHQSSFLKGTKVNSTGLTLQCCKAGNCFS